MRKQDYFPSFFAKKIIHRMILTINLKFFPKKNINLKVYYIKNKSTAAVAYLKKKKKNSSSRHGNGAGTDFSIPTPTPKPAGDRKFTSKPVRGRFPSPTRNCSKK